jgi:hypothetical protein
MHNDAKIVIIKQKQQNTMKTMQVEITSGLSVQLTPSAAHQFIMTTEDVARGYGVSTDTIRQHKSRNGDEFIENVHFVRGATFCSTLAKNAQPNQIFWTKQGIIRLGFFVKSQQAKLFRNWAERIILGHMEAARTTPARYEPENNRELGVIFQNLMYRQLVQVDNARARKRMAALLDFYVSKIK